MSHFRKMLFAAAAVASFIGTSNVASAQSNPFVCNTSFSPLVVRVEGLRELVGDIVITCQGGNPVGATGAVNGGLFQAATGFSSVATTTSSVLANGIVAQPILNSVGITGSVPLSVINGVNQVSPSAILGTPTVPAVNISVTVPGIRITNRFVGGTGSNLTDALLFIDEPTTATTGANRISQNPCTGTGGVCTGLNYFFENGLATGAGTVAGGAPLNVFQAQYGVGGGIVTNESTVTFVGVPIVQGGSRTYRIKNIRVQVAGNFSANSQISAVLSIQNPPANLVLNNANGLVGFVQQGLVFSTLQGPSYAQCLGFNVSSSNAFPSETSTSSPGSITASGALRYTEAYGVAFKRRGIAGNLDIYDNQFNQYVSGAGQANPTVNYNTESGFYNLNWTGLPNGLGDAGIASNGTRLRARFVGVPANVRIYVSAQPVTTGGSCSGSTARVATSVGNGTGFCAGQGVSAPGAAIGVQNVDAVSGATTTSSLTLSAAPVTTLTLNLQGSGPVSVQGTTPPVGNGWSATPGASYPSGTTLQFSRVTIAADGTGTYFWEVLRADDNVTDRFDFLVAAAFQSTTSIVTDAQTSVGVQVEGNYAPIATAGGNAYPSIPSFVLAPSNPLPLFSITNCATNLLYPFVTSVSGFNTGIAVANTSKDPFNTINETGICRVFFYGTTPNGGGDPQAQPFTKSVPSGQVAAFELLRGNPEWGITPVPGFQGYVIISCNFRWAHGFAFISDPSNLLTAHGYLALVLDPDSTGSTGRNFRNTGATRSESLDN
jgi:hypothetical protein